MYRYSHLDCVRLVLARLAELRQQDPAGPARWTVDIRGSDGMTPLHYAARYGLNVTERFRAMDGRTAGGEDVVRAWRDASLPNLRH